MLKIKSICWDMRRISLRMMFWWCQKLKSSLPSDQISIRGWSKTKFWVRKHVIDLKSRVEYTDWVSISLTTNKWRWTILQPITDETSKYFLTGNHLSAYMWALVIKKCPQHIFVECDWSLLKYLIFDSEWAKIQRSYSDWVSNTVNG